MTQMVTIEGSVTPSAELPRGEQRTVVYTDRIDRLVKRGYIVIVKGPWDADDPQTYADVDAAEGNQPYTTVEGTGTPNVGTEVPADGTGASGEPEPPIVPQHPAETAQHDQAAESADAALHDHSQA